MIYHQGERFTLYHGDNRAILPTLAENSVDAIVTDPPYELGFMGKSWDASGVAFDPATWREAMRVLKPGGHLLAFSGSRTYHRMAVAIEDAGFEIRDQIMWIYGSGFPKSLDIHKAINKIDGVEFREKPASGVGFMNAEGAGGYNVTINQLQQIGESSERAKQWQGWGTALKPAHEPIVVARKPLIGTVAANVLTYGTGGLNIDGARVVSDDWDAQKVLAKYTGNNNGNDSVTRNFGVKEIKSTNTESTLIGRWPANVIHDGSEEVLKLFPSSTSKSGGKSGTNANPMSWKEDNSERERFGHDDSGSAARFFYCAKTSKRDRNEGLDGFETKRKVFMATKNGTGEPSKGLERFTTTPSANYHPTVKPTDLMRYLCRLVTPKGGIVLDPFTGSGSTGKAAIYEGFNFIGIEMTDEYLPIAKARIEFATNDREETLFDA